jgi:hypothetical protein
LRAKAQEIRANLASPPHMSWMPHFDYNAPAEIFGNKGFMRGRRPVGYRRFPSGAEALRFAMEEVPGALLVGLVLEADEERFDHVAIRSLYEHPDYPLPRHDAQN